MRVVLAGQFQFLILIFVLLFSTSAISQEEKKEGEGKEDGIGFYDHGGLDISITAGSLLPFGIVGVRDTYPTWALNFSHPSPVARLEYGMHHSRGKGVIFYNFSFGPRIDFKVLDVFEAYFSFGVDFNYYQRKRTATAEFPYYYAGGGHFNFGGFYDFNKSVALRADFKTNYGPGRSMYVGVGLIYRFDGKGKEGSAEN